MVTRAYKSGLFDALKISFSLSWVALSWVITTRRMHLVSGRQKGVHQLSKILKCRNEMRQVIEHEASVLVI